jgi:hypothetical protein
MSVLVLTSLNSQVWAKAKAAPAEEEEESTQPAPEEEFLTKCYKDYVTQFAKASDPKTPKALEKIRKRCISIPFRTEWKSLAAKNNNDPLLDASEAHDSWKSHIEVKNLNLKNGTAKVILGEDEGSHCVRVKFENSGEDLRISSTKKCAVK